MSCLVLLCWFAPVLQSTESSLPPDLNYLIQQRTAYQNMSVEWSVQARARVTYYTSRFAGLDRLFVKRGDLDGVVAPETRGQDFSCSVQHYLIKDGNLWSYLDDDLHLRVGSEESRIDPTFDVRTVGLMPADPSGVTLEEFVARLEGVFSVRDDGELRHVTAVLPDGGTLEWWLDPTKGGAPHRCIARDAARRHTAEASLSYDRSAPPFWFPTQVTWKVDGVLKKTANFHSVCYDDQGLGDSIPWTELGAFPGLSVIRAGQEGKRMPIWDGFEEVPANEFWSRAKRGEVDLEKFNELVARIRNGEGQGRTPKFYDPASLEPRILTHAPSLWEDYTRRFIQRFRLEGEQIDRAWMHLKECQKPAYAYLDEQKSAIREAETERAKVAAELAKVEAELAKVAAELAKVEADRAKPAANPSRSAGAKAKSSAGAGTKDETSGSARTKDDASDRDRTKDEASGSARTKDEASAGDRVKVDASAGGSSQERSAAKASDPTSADAADDAGAKPRAALQDELEKLDERLKKLYEPIEKIFEEKLKPGLAKLPTQAQIDAARAREGEAADHREAELSRTAVEP
ncbi:MAG: hypothetical protein HS102_11725 [Planctomycetia bacterium]|nr:hypothetical protein [Planctomycetia bacterium]